MVVKVQGEFVWHAHDDTDDFFLVLKSRLTNWVLLAIFNKRRSNLCCDISCFFPYRSIC